MGADQHGVAQRARALNAFLADVYGDHRSAADRDRAPDIVRAGIIPDGLIRALPLQPAAMGLAVGRPRASVYGLDMLTDESGRWVVLEDNLQVPSGVSYALANRSTAEAVLTEVAAVAPSLGVRPLPRDVGGMLLQALRVAAPPNCTRSEPQVVVLSDGPGNSAWYEHRTLAALMGVPVVGAADLYPDGSGVAARTAVGLLAVDVVYRRLGSDDLLGRGGAAAVGGVGELLCAAAAAATPRSRTPLERGRRRQGDLPVRRADDPFLPRRGTGAGGRRHLGAGRSGQSRRPRSSGQPGGQTDRRIGWRGGPHRPGTHRGSGGRARAGGRGGAAPVHRSGGDPVTSPDTGG